MKTYEEMARDTFDRITEYKSEQKKRRKAIFKISSVVLSLCLVAIIGIGFWKSDILKSETPMHEPEPGYNPVIEPEDTTAGGQEIDYPSLEKSVITLINVNSFSTLYTTASGLNTSLTSHIVNESTDFCITDSDDKYAVLSIMAGKWLQSMLFRDYSTLYSLFPDEVQDFFWKNSLCDYSYIESSYSSLAEALAKADKVNSDILPFDTFNFKYDVVPVEMFSSVEEFLEWDKDYGYCFANYPGIDVSKITDVAVATVGYVSINVNGGIELEIGGTGGDTFIIYEYNGKWYVWATLLYDEELFAMISNETSHYGDYYAEESYSGVVLEINDGMIIMGPSSDSKGEYCFYFKNAEKCDFSVGDNITVTYYNGFSIWSKNHLRCKTAVTISHDS